MVILSGRPQTYDPNGAASAARSAELDRSSMISPAIVLAASTDPAGRVWTARRDLLGSGPHASDFVIEVDDEGQTGLRFGDGVYGKYPQDETLWASYRIGNGSVGNVGAEALYHIVSGITGIVRARNPLAACGGTNPESIEQVRLHAPYHFHKQLRAVTADDYRAVLQDFPEVRDAQVSRRYTGSFYTTIITVLRVGSLPVDTAFKVRLRAFLDRYRMVGNDLQIAAAVEVPIDIKLVVEVLAGHSRSAVLETLKVAFSSGVRNGQNGLFHPDRCTLGQALFLSQIINTAMQQKGVSWVEAERFHRYTDSSALCVEVIKLRPNEVLLVANDDAAPERGRLEFSIGGGL
jgi:predicted phage baseplate assembly protein